MILEDILAQVGNNGCFQLMFCSLIYCMEMVMGFSMMQAAIFGATPDWWCVPPSSSGENVTLTNLTLHQCSSSTSSSSACNGPIRNHSNNTNCDSPASTESLAADCVHYFDPSLRSVVSEWDLVCGMKYISALIKSVQMAGVMVGAVIAGQSSDTVGRRIPLFITLILHTLSSLLAGLSVNWAMFAACRFFVGMGIGSFMVLHHLYMVEFVSPTWRPYLASIPAWQMGTGILCLTAWRVPHWRYLHYICAALSLLLTPGWFISPESVRWLAAKGRISAAERVVERIARINGRSEVGNTREQLTLLSQEEKAQNGHSRQRYAYHTLFRSWRDTIKTLIVMYLWMVMSMAYYGISFGVSALSGNIYLNLFLLITVEVPLTAFVSVLIIHFGRRKIACIMFLLTSITAFGILIADRTGTEESKGTIITAIAMCSMAFTSAGWICMQTFTAELYPTVIRSIGVGTANTAARFGGILAPFVLEMETSDDAVKCYVIVGSLMAISGFLVLLLKETKGQALADTLHQDQTQMTDMGTMEENHNLAAPLQDLQKDRQT